MQRITIMEFFHFMYAPGVDADSDNVLYLEDKLNEIEKFKSLVNKDESFWKSSQVW